jgi:small subunit ribosomal protein S16
MLKIRMQRIGRINQPAYRIIVVEHTESPKTGNFIDTVGTYNPRTKDRKLDEGKIKHWMSVGAQPSATVHNMLISAGILKGKKINVLPKFVEPAPAVAEAVADKKEEVVAEAAPVAEAVAAEESKAEVAAETTAQ